MQKFDSLDMGGVIYYNVLGIKFIYGYINGDFEMDKYKKLLSNTFIFAIAAFGSKLLVFLMMPFYTRVMSTEEYGIADVLVQTCNLLIPFATIGINNAIIRFGLEKDINRKSVFTIGLVTILSGFVILCLLSPIINRVSVLHGYVGYIVMFVLASALHGLCSQFARAVGYVKFYAVDGIFATFLTVVLNIVFLAGFGWGVEGYIMATIITDLVCAVMVFVFTKQWRFIGLKSITEKLYLKMLSYCAPLIPNTVCSLIVSISDRYLITYMIGESANGIYAVANKIPTILMIVANIFAEAWQISAVTEEKEREVFFSRVCGVYQAIAFTVATILVVTSQISTAILAAPEYYVAWQYIPLLVCATTFSCIATFLSSVYMVEKKSNYTLLTTMLAAVVNIVLNMWWIPTFGIYGAAVATFLSYFIIFVVRAVHTRKFIKIKWNMKKLSANIILLALQIVVMMTMFYGYIVVSALIAVIIIAINFSDLVEVLRKKFIK